MVLPRTVVVRQARLRITALALRAGLDRSDLGHRLQNKISYPPKKKRPIENHGLSAYSVVAIHAAAKYSQPGSQTMRA